MKTKELQECPFCESNYAGMVKQISTDGEVYVNCLDCGSAAPIKEWNSAHCWDLLEEKDARIQELEDSVKKYVTEKENVVPDVTMILHTFKRLKEALSRQGNEEGKQE